jgi:hypothetical protein
MFMTFLVLAGCPTTTPGDTAGTGDDTASSLPVAVAGALEAEERFQGEANGEFDGAVNGCSDVTAEIASDAAEYDALIAKISNCGGGCPSSGFNFTTEIALVAWVYCSDICDRDLSLSAGVVAADGTLTLDYLLDISSGGACGDSVSAEYVSYAVDRAAYGAVTTTLARTTDGA